jgi:hypothetical protein
MSKQYLYLIIVALLAIIVMTFIIPCNCSAKQFFHEGFEDDTVEDSVKEDFEANKTDFVIVYKDSDKKIVRSMGKPNNLINDLNAFEDEADKNKERTGEAKDKVKNFTCCKTNILDLSKGTDKFDLKELIISVPPRTKVILSEGQSVASVIVNISNEPLEKKELSKTSKIIKTVKIHRLPDIKVVDGFHMNGGSKKNPSQRSEINTEDKCLDRFTKDPMAKFMNMTFKEGKFDSCDIYGVDSGDSKYAIYAKAEDDMLKYTGGIVVANEMMPKVESEEACKKACKDKKECIVAQYDSKGKCKWNKAIGKLSSNEKDVGNKKVYFKPS